METLDQPGRLRVITAAFLGWMFAGVTMSLMSAATRPAIQSFFAGMDAAELKVQTDQWFSWYLTAFLLGAALGGAVFGTLADRCGRAKAMGWSILCYAGFTGLSYLTQTPHQLLVLRFLACMGVGGMWPAGVALVAEAWPKVSRPMLAGLIGASANVGFLILGLLMLAFPVTAASWRWVLLAGSAPLLLAVWVLKAVPESPSWRRSREQGNASAPLRTVFKPPLLRLTLLGILLGTVPLLGGWASGQRLVPWAGNVGEDLNIAHLKAVTQVVWAVGAVLGSLAGGWVAHRLGCRRSYFMVSLASLLLSGWIFLTMQPGEWLFYPAIFLLGIVSVLFFGWLPYYLPQLFPTAVRGTGAGVSFNFGRILSAVAILSSAALSRTFAGDIAKMGAVTSLIYVLGMVIIWFVPEPDKEDRH